ncbi:MAG: hypothetical protein CMP10_12090 [Zetaproteobacteria bacterium]|nr:hypothetical protein [Pseudobdellovibrionaceae bacterium]
MKLPSVEEAELNHIKFDGWVVDGKCKDISFSWGFPEEPMIDFRLSPRCSWRYRVRVGSLEVIEEPDSKVSTVFRPWFRSVEPQVFLKEELLGKYDKTIRSGWFRTWFADRLGIDKKQIGEDEISTPVKPNFKNDILPVLDRYCIPCHSQAGSYPQMPLETSDQLKQFGDDVLESITYGRMPLDEELPEPDRYIFESWYWYSFP